MGKLDLLISAHGSYRDHEFTTDGLVLVFNVTNCVCITKLIDEHIWIMDNDSSALALSSCDITVLGTYLVFCTFV